MIEDIHDHITDAGPSLRPSLATLQAEQDELKAKGSAGKLNQMRQAVASDSKAVRFALVGVKDFSVDGERQLDAAQTIVTSKWPSIFPENRQFNFPEKMGSFQQSRGTRENGAVSLALLKAKVSSFLLDSIRRLSLVGALLIVPIRKF